MRNIPVLYEHEESCCGCYACYSICPKEAIVMIENKEGFDYPQIIQEKCVYCCKCINVCPIKQSI